MWNIKQSFPNQIIYICDDGSILLHVLIIVDAHELDIMLLSIIYLFILNNQKLIVATLRVPYCTKRFLPYSLPKLRQSVVTCLQSM